MSARILIIDDVPANTRLLGARLGAEYFEVRTAHDGPAALAEALAWQPDLILLDVMMPGMDGYETCRRLKADVRTLHIPVVMVTTLDQTDERVRGLEAGADDFLTKPVDFDTLLARVKSLVRLKRLLDEWRMRGQTAHALGLSANGFAPPAVAGARALVVDDDDASAQAIQDALLRDGVLAARARSEAETMELVRVVDFALVVISLSMLTDDPLRLASRLRAQETTQETPLLLIAESAQRDRLLRGFDLGANDWLIRPLDANELRARARNQIRRKFYQDRLRADLGHALELALTDPLTGFYNQRYLMRHLHGLLDGGGGDMVAVMMLDLDHFKEVNDRWGHPVGDQALRVVAETLRGRVRVFDSIARYGGEEFVVVMPGASAQEAQGAAERLRSAIEQIRFEPEPGQVHQLTVSIGVACSAPGRTPEQVLQMADAALYTAKNAGRNCMKMAAQA
ncbi:MAG: PleD family two-component system response regulator [Rhodospirillales bacterium 70-18]|nr:PleD family two-component system response regulator [Rhodospirillales bacterium]OJY64160.1 MAG: PleD family two-component system response regulator [Rhodospirillales bacterium 70-18]